jgi:DNA invertase Pin-like site-specific DNA recombinase
MRIALYARSSTRGQKLTAQLEALRDYAAHRGGEALEFVDRGVSGAQDRRPALDRLMEAVRRREVNAVAITKLDRMARSVRHLTEVAAELEAVRVSLVVLDQAIDTGTPSGQLLFNVLGSIAEFERDLIRERVSAGLKAAKRRGQQLGRPPALDARGIARARRLRASGHSVRAIAGKLGVGSSTVQRVTRGVAG